MRKKQHLYCGPLCSFPVVRWDVSIFLQFFFLLSFLSLLSLPKQRTDSAVPNAKEQKMENILLLLLLLLRSHHEAFFLEWQKQYYWHYCRVIKWNKKEKEKKRKAGRKKKLTYNDIMVKQSSSQSSLYIVFFWDEWMYQGVKSLVSDDWLAVQ